MKYLPLFKFLCLAIIAAFLAWKGQPFLYENEKALDIIINVFSILSGFLIAILTLFSDIRVDGANWRKLELQEQVQVQRYNKHALLFFAYLSVLITAFVTNLLIGQPNSIWKNSLLVIWLERICLFLTILSITYSLFLPSNLIKMRKKELNKLKQSIMPNYLR